MTKRRREALANSGKSEESDQAKRSKGIHVQSGASDNDNKDNVTRDDIPDNEIKLNKIKSTTSKATESSLENDEKTLTQQSSFDGDDSDKGSMMEETNHHLYQELLDVVLKMKDNNGRQICELFIKLPPKQSYPEYYRVIKEPIDLKMIYARVKNNSYTSLDDIEKDLLLLVKNAHAFNEPGSQVYKDATTIKKTVSAKRLEIEHTMSGAKSSKRLRSKRSTSKMSLAIHALLSDTDDEDELETDLSTPFIEEDDNDEKNTSVLLEGDEEDPLLALYNSVQVYVDYSGRMLSEAFMRLPSKRTYPDYYEVIKNPIGLLRIGSNIKNSYYESLDSLVEDMMRCFENAKAYNETESMLYQDAAILQDVVQSRKSELVKISLEKGIPLSQNTKKHGRDDNEDVESKQIKDKTTVRTTKKSNKKLSEHDANILKKRFREMYNAVESYQDDDGRYLSQLFLELPSATLYPDYYEIISEPTCLKMIDKNINDNKYTTEQEFLLDFEIMFENAKHYNEVESQVHQDALTLDRVLKKKRKSLGRLVYGHGDSTTVVSPSIKQGASHIRQQTTPTKSTRSLTKSTQGGTITDLKELCKELYNSIKDYTDNTGRYLCGIFQKLPSKADYPDYYALIKRPIDMAKILSKVHADQYTNLEECFQDFVLMFDNACKYNDPDSQVYKDSLVLLKELIATKLELLGDCETQVPYVPDLVQKIIEELYDSLIAHKDDEGRSFTDSLINIPNTEDIGENGQKKNILSLPTIGKLVKKLYYKRLDKFQEDLFSFFEKLRTNSLDSELYDDAVECQLYFVQQRDRICKDGERFVSPAISQTKRHLSHDLDEERKRKTRELSNTTEETPKEEDSIHTKLTELQFNDQNIFAGDYVLVDSSDVFIVGVEKMWVDDKAEKWLHGVQFLKPEQTKHDVSRKFMPKEVFQSDQMITINVNQIQKLCCVMFVKNYIKVKPLDFEEVDTYVCESQYNAQKCCFKKMKTWSNHGHSIRNIPREQSLLLERCCLSNNDNKEMTIKDDEELIETLLQKTEQLKNLEIENATQEVFTNYEQYCLDNIAYKLGDTVYCRTDEGYWTIARIDKIWAGQQGTIYFSATTFIKPDNTQHLPTHMFYDQEVFHIPTEEIHRISDIVRKCCVLPIRDYMRCRPTDVSEEDVFLCECRYDEDEGGHFRKLKGLKKPVLSTNVYEEEVYFFEENLNVVKKPSPLLVQDISNLKRDDRLPPPSRTDNDTQVVKKRARSQNGFLMYSAERRTIIRKQHPDYNFGEISRTIGNEWKNLEASKKEEWEAKAQYQISSKPTTSVSYFGNGIVYDCFWHGCDYQYEDLDELIIHVLESGAHLVKLENGVCPCLWANCDRLKRGLRPFQSLTKLIKHCRELHLKTAQPRRIEFHERKKNYFPKNQTPLQPESSTSSSEQTSVVVHSTVQQQAGNTAFVGVVPSPTPSHLLSSQQSINTNLMDSQFSNVMRLPTPGLAQTMMGMASPYHNMITGVPRQTSVVNNAATSINHFPQITSMVSTVSQPQYTASVPPFTSPYQHGMTSDVPAVNQLPASYSNTIQSTIQQPCIQQQPPTNLRQPSPLQSDQRQALQQPSQTMFNLQRPQLVESAENTIAPLFHSPPPRQQKLLHSDAYLRYIEGLRDGTPHLSNWNPNKPEIGKMTSQQQSQLPVQWLGTTYNPYPTTVDALWALREHMLNDALKLAKFNNNNNNP